VYPLYWYGSKIQDYWIDNNWRKLLKKGMEVRLWTIQSSRVIGMQCLLKGQWVDAWCVGNDFRERERDKHGKKISFDK